MPRELVKIVKINNINPIENADRIEVVTCGGWEVVCAKGKHHVGEEVIFFEIDSFLPVREEFEFLRKSCFRNVRGLGEGFRIRTSRLRKQLSQGLVMSIKELSHLIDFTSEEDLAKQLGVVKYDPPQNSAILVGERKGSFPSFIPKTDQERIQNLSLGKIKDQEYEVTLKLDGSSCTLYIKDGEVGVCSRNFELKINEANKNLAFIKVFHEQDLENKLKRAFELTGKNLALQGELVGPGIQKNHCGLRSLNFYAFDIFDIDNQCYLSSKERLSLCEELKLLHVPVISHSMNLNGMTKKDILRFSDESPGSNYKNGDLNIKTPEGLVFKSLKNPDFSFKAISNRFLLKEKE